MRVFISRGNVFINDPRLPVGLWQVHCKVHWPVLMEVLVDGKV
jgi:hypothetical protein